MVAGPGEHYFTKQPGAQHVENRFRAKLRAREFEFFTDAGVFARERVDPGTRLLVEEVDLGSGAGGGPVRRVLDLGCGWGAIGIAIAGALPEAEVVGVEVNERAVDLSRRNASQNGIRNFRVITGDATLLSPVELGVEAEPETRAESGAAGAVFDLVVSNPPIRAGKAVVWALVDVAWRFLAPGGRLVMVARTSQGGRSLEKRLAEVFGDAATVGRGGGYRLLEARKAGRPE